MTPDARIDLTTDELLRLAKAGDGAAVEALYTRYLALLHRWARGRLPAGTRGAADTGDIVQETLVRALRHLETFESRGPDSFFAYLRQTFVNRVRDEARRLARRPIEVDLLESPTRDPSPEELAIGAETLERFDRAVAKLAPTEREAVMARVERGFSYAQIAEALGKPTPDAARMTVSRALVKLAHELAV